MKKPYQRNVSIVGDTITAAKITEFKVHEAFTASGNGVVCAVL